MRFFCSVFGKFGDTILWKFGDTKFGDTILNWRMYPDAAGPDGLHSMPHHSPGGGDANASGGTAAPGDPAVTAA